MALEAKLLEIFARFARNSYHAAMRDLETLASQVIDTAMGVHIDVGPGLLEIKAVASLAPIHTRQTLTYLRLMKLPLGLLISFGGITLKDGLKRVVNNYRGDSSGKVSRETRQDFEESGSRLQHGCA